MRKTAQKREIGKNAKMQEGAGKCAASPPNPYPTRTPRSHRSACPQLDVGGLEEVLAEDGEEVVALLQDAVPRQGERVQLGRETQAWGWDGWLYRLLSCMKEPG